jgi:hypothetical protein
MGKTVMTGHRWIIDVLADLKAFAEQNNLPLLAAQLGETALVAQIEIAQLAEAQTEGAMAAGQCAAPLAAQGDNAGTRNISRPGGTC